jgi:hypothetical protein
MISVKDIRTLDEFKDLDHRARSVFEWIYVHAWPPGLDMIVTRIQGPPIKGETGVHQSNPHRAFDLSTRALQYDKAKKIEQTINASWEYDSARPQMDVALYHDSGSGYHLHVQVHANTAQRAEPRITT